MVNRGSFQGRRKEFLLSQKADYALAVRDRHTAETLSQILRKYFKRFPIDLPDSHEPTEEQLASVDDNAPDPELSDHGTSSSESDSPRTSSPPRKKKKKRAKQSSKSRKKRIEFRREQIKRWLAYQYAKDNCVKEKENGAFDPFKVLLPRFIDEVKAHPPRRKPGFNHWRKTKRPEINEVLNTQVEQAKLSGTPILSSHFAARRESIARAMYDDLPEEEKKHWEEVADSEHELAMAQHQHLQEEAISTSPADRQRAIQRLAWFIQPILDLICAVTGWKASLIAGGPEPALNGQFSAISVHSGETNGPSPMNFGVAQREVYKKYIIPEFGKFLQLCYDRDECRSRALDPQDGFIPMAELMESEPAVQSVLIHPVGQAPLPLGPAITTSDAVEIDRRRSNPPAPLPLRTTPGANDPAAIEDERRQGDGSHDLMPQPSRWSPFEPSGLEDGPQDEEAQEPENPFPLDIQRSPSSAPPSPAPSPGTSPTPSNTHGSDHEEPPMLILSGPPSHMVSPSLSDAAAAPPPPPPPPPPPTSTPLPSPHRPVSTLKITIPSRPSAHEAPTGKKTKNSKKRKRPARDLEVEPQQQETAEAPTGKDPKKNKKRQQGTTEAPTSKKLKNDKRRGLAGDPASVASAGATHVEQDVAGSSSGGKRPQRDRVKSAKLRAMEG